MELIIGAVNHKDGIIFCASFLFHNFAHVVLCRLIFLCQQNSRGIGEEVILVDMPSLKGQPLADAINRLMKKVTKFMPIYIVISVLHCLVT